MSDDDEIATYIGPKGYTIIKEYLDYKEIVRIKKELTVRPFVPKTALHKPPGFPIYRETKKKIYLPRFYGLENYDEPDATYISAGTKIDVEFKGDLREYQKPVVNKWLSATREKGCGLIEADCGAGKTCMAIYLIAKLGLKTLIIVHKDFLLRQWKERLEQFMPDAKIGRIQGPTIDIEGKDVVIGMLQSLSMKDYDSSLFLDFGFTIIDECHHISAEVFSRVLFKAVTKYMLGLSATMNRQDGLTRVFKMFLGNVEAKWKRGAQKNVVVKAIDYLTDDEDFSRNLLNYRGQPDYVRMISKLCKFSPRTEFILSVVKDMWTENDKQQIMIIGHQKTQLIYIHDAIKHRGFATVGYYMGGMKEQQLKITEGKNIIIATYKMAEEALDIKTLTTIVMATPKKDVRQAVGRILRTSGEKLVIDIIDQHHIFQRHWTQRRRWYNRQEFKILRTTSDKYRQQQITSSSTHNQDIWTPEQSRSIGRKKRVIDTQPYTQSDNPIDKLLRGRCLT